MNHTFCIAHNPNQGEWAWLLRRTQYCFSIHGPCEEVQWSLTLEQACWPIFFVCIILVYNLSPLNWGNKKKFFEGKKKKKLKACTKPVTWGFKLWPWEEWLEKHFESIYRLNLSDFLTNYIIVPYAQDFLPVNFVQVLLSKPLLPAAAKFIVNQWNDVCD